MALSLITLNTGGCCNITRNASLKNYFELLAPKNDIILLQETYNVKSNHPCWKNWPNYIPICAPGSAPGSGVTTLIHRNIEAIASGVIASGSILYVKVKINNDIFNIYNVLIPQSNSFALKYINDMDLHCNQCSDGATIIGRDFNCTDSPFIDRLNKPTEHRPQISMALRNYMNKNSLCDVWRRLNPSNSKFTWFRFTNSDRVSKAT